MPFFEKYWLKGDFLSIFKEKTSFSQTSDEFQDFFKKDFGDDFHVSTWKKNHLERHSALQQRLASSTPKVLAFAAAVSMWKNHRLDGAKGLVNNGTNYQSQLVVWDFWSITSINTLEKKPFLLPWTTSVGFWRAVGPQVPVRHLRSRQVSRAGKERKKGNPFLAAKRRYTPHCCDIIPAESGNCAHISKEIDHRLFISIYIYVWKNCRYRYIHNIYI